MNIAWPVVFALLIVIPIILIAVALFWYMNESNLFQLVRGMMHKRAAVRYERQNR
ncbi:MAG: hypothetical protein ABIH70_09395 [Chloroflexota bacterium]